MKHFIFTTIIFLLYSFSSIFAQNVYHPEKNIDEAKRYYTDKITELDQVEGIYKAHLDVDIRNPFTNGRHFTQDYYFWIFDPKKAQNDNWSFVMINLFDGEIGIYADVKKNGSTYSFQEKDYSNNLVTVKFQMVSPFQFSYSRHEGGSSGVYSSSTRTTTATKIFPTREMYQAAIYKEQSKYAPTSGTGFLINNQGYIITNYHVIENAQNNNIKVTGFNGDYYTTYKARVEIFDKQNDLAILKTLTNTKFDIPYSFKFSTANVGEECFVLGYPLISSMGKELKLTNGIISAKTGYDGSYAQYQISAPVQPGNSGGPLFDKDGNIIGVVQAKHRQAENAGYAIKSSYIKNLVEMLPVSIQFPQINKLRGKSLPQQVKLAGNSVCIILVNDK